MKRISKVVRKKLQNICKKVLTTTGCVTDFLRENWGLNDLMKEINLEKFEKKIGHKIQIFVHSKNEIEKMKKDNKELLNNFINGIVI